MTFRAKASVVRLLITIAFVLLAGTALSAQTRTYNFMPGTDFSKQK
jgi:hypothetical protein